MVGNSSKGRCGRVYREARVQAGMIQGRNRKWEVSGLKTGQRRDVQVNVATFQRGNFQRRDVETNVATFQRGKCSNVATFQRMLKINVATLDINFATFQRSLKSTSRRWISAS